MGQCEMGSLTRLIGSILISWMLIHSSAGVEECLRYSPQEIWFSDHSPLLNKTIEEMKVYFQVAFAKLDGNLFKLMPHIKDNETEAGKLADDVVRIREKLAADLESYYREIERCWAQLSHNTEDLIHHIKHLQRIVFILNGEYILALEIIDFLLKKRTNI